MPSLRHDSTTERIAATLVTINIQAPGFYAQHGWEEFGRVPSLPGVERVFFRKTLPRNLKEPS